MQTKSFFLFFFQHYSLDIFLRQYWTDYRLAFRNLNQAMYINSSVVFSNEIAELIWLPDPFFPLSKKGELHQLTKPNLVFELSPDGTIFFSQRLVLVNILV